MEKKKNLINLIFSPKLLIIEWSFIILFCVFIGFSTHSKAATTTNLDLPLTIGIPDSLSDLGVTSEVVETVKSRYLSILAGYGANPSDSYTIFVEQIDSQNLIYITATSQLEITNSSQITTDYLLTYRNISQHFVQFTFDPNTNVLSQGNFYGGWIAEWRPFTKQTMAVGKGWVLDSAVEFPNYWVFPTNQPDTTGHATPPDISGDNIGNDKPDIDDYMPTQPNQPIFDNSNLESMVESLYNWLKWEYNAITSTIKGLINYLSDTITYSIQKVIDNIKNAIQNFYDNMKSLFEPLLNGMAEITQGIKETIDTIVLLLEEFFAPFDEEAFQEAYENCEFINAVDGINDSIEEFEHAFSYAEERDYYTLYLGFIMDGYTVNYDLDFSWLYPLRQYYRPIIWAVVVYEFFVYFVAQLSDYISGRSGK